MVDVGAIIKSATKSERVYYGSKESIGAIRMGRAVAVVIANNCPLKIKDDVEKFAFLSSIPVYDYPGTGRELGMVCRKPFVVSVLTVREIPESDLALAVKESIKQTEEDQTQI